MKQKRKSITIILILWISLLAFTLPVQAGYELPKLEKTIEIPTSIKQVSKRLPSRFLATMGRAFTKYNLKDELTLNVKNQGDKNICWACSSNSVFETTTNRAMQSNYIFSDDKLDYEVNQVRGKTTEQGGNPFMAYAYYTSGNSPVTVTQQKTDLELDGYVMFPMIYKAKVEGKTSYSDQPLYLNGNLYTEDQVNLVRQQMKEHIQTYGAVTAAMYASDGQYYNNDLTAYYCDSAMAIPDHQVTIIGWDDNYAVENFNENHRPTKPGAYIIMNSHGTDVYDKGFLAISYEDSLIESYCLGITGVSKTKEQDETLYQYDELGINSNVASASDAYGANIFERNTQDQEQLTEIKMATLGAGTYELYVNPNNEDLTQLQKVKTITVGNAGYQTIPLTTPLQLTGHKFVIGIKAIKGNLDSYAQIGVETKAGEFWKNATSNQGESYLSMDGQYWEDLKELGNEINCPDANICLKAVTTKGVVQIIGDINQDGQLDLRDLSILVTHLSGGQTLTGEKLQAADVTQDGEVDTRDLSKIVLLLAESV